MKKFISLILIMVAMISLVSCEEALGEIMLQVALEDKGDKTEIEGGYLHWKEVEGGYELASATIVVNKKKFTTFEIPSEFNGKPVVAIGNAAFFGWSDLEAITIPDTVTRVGDGAFAFCSSLKSIDIPDSVTDIGEEVFKGCASLENVTFPEEMTVLKSNMFELGAFSVTVKFGSKLEVIEDRAFDGSATIYVGKSLKKIYYTAFNGSGAIRFDGTMEEWMQVERLVGEREEEESDFYSIFIYCTDGTMLKSNTIDYWVVPEDFFDWD